jgi:hypothetical protein
MKTFYYILTVAVLCAVLQFWLPWWIIVVVSFLLGYMSAPHKWLAFWAGFTGVFLLWCAMALIAESKADISIAALLGNLLGNIPGFAVVILTGVTGGICAGLGGLLGRWTKELFSKPPLA